MAAWTFAVLLAKSSAVLLLPMVEGSARSLFSSKHRCSGLKVFVLGPFVGTLFFATTVHCPLAAALAYVRFFGGSPPVAVDAGGGGGGGDGGGGGGGPG